MFKLAANRLNLPLGRRFMSSASNVNAAAVISASAPAQAPTSPSTTASTTTSTITTARTITTQSQKRASNKTTKLKMMLNSNNLEYLMEAHNGLSAKIVEET
eukprot:Pgem_evm1s19564